MAKTPRNDSRSNWIIDNLPPELTASTLFRFNVKLQTYETDADGKPVRKQILVDILPDLDLDYDLLEDQMYNLPSQYAFWSAVYSEVRLGVAVAERKLKARRAEVVKLLKKEGADNNVKISADLIKVILEADPRLNEAEMNFQNAQMLAGKLYHQIEALKMKSELARSLLGMKKKEHENT